MRAGGPKAAKRPRTERATYQLSLNTLRFECRSINDLQCAQRRSRFERKGNTSLKGEAVLSAAEEAARRLAPPREARSGTSRRKSDFISQHKGPQHPVGVGDRAGAFRPALDLIHGLHTNQHLANDGILAIKERPVFEHDEELGIG